MADILIEIAVSEAERMFTTLKSLPEDHENYPFLVDELHREVTKAGDMLRSKMMEITAAEKEAYTDRVDPIRNQLGPFLSIAKKMRDKAESDRREREWQRSRWR